MLIREVKHSDLSQLLELYTNLHDNEMPIIGAEIETLWSNIIDNRNHHIIVGVMNDTIISSCVVIIIPNLTHRQMPYALVENVITHPKHRGKGYATQILNHAKMVAKENNCYKIMLMSGSKKQATLGFYERAGYNRNDKTAFIQWLDR